MLKIKPFKHLIFIFGLSTESVYSPKIFSGIWATWGLEVCSKIPLVIGRKEASKLYVYGLQLWTHPLAAEASGLLSAEIGSHPNSSETTTMMASTLISSNQLLRDKSQHPRCPHTGWLSKYLRAPALNSLSWWLVRKPVEPDSWESGGHSSTLQGTHLQGTLVPGTSVDKSRWNLTSWPLGFTYRNTSILCRCSYFSLPLEISCTSLWDRRGYPSPSLKLGSVTRDASVLASCCRCS